MEVTITDLNHDGRGRGKSGDRTALVCGAYPGDHIVMKVDRVTRGTFQGRPARLLNWSDDHHPHPCRHEGHCTGCPFLAYDPQAELVFKHDRVRTAIESVDAALAARIEPVVRPTGPFGYRHLAKMTFARRKGRTVLGSYVTATHTLTDNRGCPVLTAPLADLMDQIADIASAAGVHIGGSQGRKGLRHAIARHSRATGQQLLLLVTDHEDTEPAARFARRLVDEVEALAGACVALDTSGGNNLFAGRLQGVVGAGAIEEELLGHRHQIGPRSFFQINPVAAEAMFRAALEEVGRGQTCVEVFAGVGALTRALAERFAKVIAIEAHSEAAASLRAAAKREPRIEAVEGRAEVVLAAVLERSSPEAIVLDPPRKGLGPAVTAAVARSTARRVVLLSCEPSALSRDLPALLEAGFEVTRVAPFDPFPRTAHVEALTVLARA